MGMNPRTNRRLSTILTISPLRQGFACLLLLAGLTMGTACLAPPDIPPATPPATQPHSPAEEKNRTGRDEQQQDQNPKEKIPREEIRIGDEIFKLEIAATPKTREKGLMGRKEIKKHGGMIFIYPRQKRMSFWMKNCLIDIDIIFIDRLGRITAMYEMKKEPLIQDGETALAYELRLKLYSSRTSAQFALELKPGWLKKLKLKVGQRIKLDTKRLTRMAQSSKRR